MLRSVGQAHGVQHASRSFKPVASGHTGIDQRKLNIFYGRQAGQKIVGLEDESDTCITYGRLFVGLDLGDVPAIEEEVPTAWGIQ